MSLKDKLEIGLKPDAPYRQDNLPEFQKDDPACQVAAEPGDSPDLEEAREECTSGAAAKPDAKVSRNKKAAGPERTDGVNHN